MAVSGDNMRPEDIDMDAYYTDTEFPENSSLLCGFNNDTCKEENDGDMKDKVIWKRAKKLFKNPRFIVDEASYHDLDQGELDDCWFIAAATTLAATQKQLFQKVVPLPQDFEHNYTGKFHFNFWSYGEWKTVEVDDFLPTKNNKLIYSRNKELENEFWPALLEKAYAKLWGSYERLADGFFNDAMVDLTGGISEVIYLRREEDNKKHSNLFTRLMRSFQKKSLLGVSTIIDDELHFLLECPRFQDDRERLLKLKEKLLRFGGGEKIMLLGNGLVQKHVYSVVDVQELNVQHGYKLLRLRNPYGHTEWTGSFSDNSNELKMYGDRIREELQNKIRDDGEFWITFEDLVDNFDKIEMCHLEADAILEEPEDNRTPQEWNVNVYHDKWVSSGDISSHLYWSNPQFYLELKTADSSATLTGTCIVIISLMKKQRQKRSTNAIAFRIYKTEQAGHQRISNRNGQKPVEQARTNYIIRRENTQRFELPAGHYVIIPSTTGSEAGESENSFLLRIFTESPAASWAMTGQDEEKKEEDHKDEEEDHKDEEENHKDEEEDHKDEEEDHKDEEEDHKDEEENHKDEEEDHKDEEEDHKDEEENHKDEEEDHKDEEEDHKDEEEDHKDEEEDHKDEEEDHKDEEENHKDEEEDHKDEEENHKDEEEDHKEKNDDSNDKSNETMKFCRCC